MAPTAISTSTAVTYDTLTQPQHTNPGALRYSRRAICFKEGCYHLTLKKWETLNLTPQALKWS
ncbi:MAG: hypothetical protein H0A76_05685 [Candidatus Thiodubiliella endoseptemdiera]|uniref:Uncharacterized protein n=1 Tax=Candidatus Thiodubiliella endoseptemdiera TaxID=2738886 RepID=A0A853F4B4_9GAMM|nr:hypothetical protein [Candidatus Thiodubiliella endoseptemdiera]